MVCRTEGGGGMKGMVEGLARALGVGMQPASGYAQTPKLRHTLLLVYFLLAFHAALPHAPRLAAEDV